MSRTVANFIVAAAGLAVILSPRSTYSALSIPWFVPLAAAMGAVLLVIWSTWGDRGTRLTRVVAYFILLVAVDGLLTHNHYANRRVRTILAKDASTLERVATAIRQEVTSTGGFPVDFDSMLRRYAIPFDELKSPITREADPKAPPVFEMLDSETGFFRRGDFIWVYTDLDPADYAAHIIGFDVALNRPGRVVVYGGAESEFVLSDEFPTLIAQENRRRADRGLKPISKEITQIAAEER